MPDSAPPPPTLRLETGLPLVGVIPSLLQDGPGFLLEAASRGPLFALQLGPVQVPVISDPDHLQEVLVDRSKDFVKGGMWEATRPLLGNGLVTSDGEVWKAQRQAMQPMFTPRQIGLLAEQMILSVNRQLDRLDEKSGETIDVGAEMTQITQRVLMDTMFGTHFPTEKAERLGQHLQVAMDTMNIRIFTYFLPEWMPRPGGNAFFASIRAIDEALFELLTERRAHPSSSPDLLTMLLGAKNPETGEGFSDRDLRDQLLTLFTAGLDTTAITLTWLLHLLDLHPSVALRIRSEIPEGPLDRETLSRMAYTRQVIQETLRLYPPAWIFPRYTASGTTIGGLSIAPGTSLLVSPWLTHRDPRHWPDPHRFDPDRFLSPPPNRMQYIPFGAGGRQCIGNHFAMMEATIATALLLRRYRATHVDQNPVLPTAASTLKPKGGLKMKLQRLFP